MTVIFIREKQCFINYFVYAQFNGQEVCYCNWSVLSGPPAGVYSFTGLPGTFFAQLLAAGILFNKGQAIQMQRLILGYPLTAYIIV